MKIQSKTHCEKIHTRMPLHTFTKWFISLFQFIRLQSMLGNSQFIGECQYIKLTWVRQCKKWLLVSCIPNILQWIIKSEWFLLQRLTFELMKLGKLDRLPVWKLSCSYTLVIITHPKTANSCEKRARPSKQINMHICNKKWYHMQ